jgi:hypothetical protein
VGQELCANAFARILYDYLVVRLATFQIDTYLSVGWSEFHCVGKEVPNDLLQAIGIS